MGDGDGVTRIDIEPFISKILPEIVRGRRGFAGPTWNDLLVLLALSELRRPKRCLEIGVHEGHTAALLLEQGSWIKEYIGIDCLPRDPKKLAPINAGKMALGDKRFRAITPAGGTRGILPADIPGRFDWIFIDSDHSYEGVTYDTTFASKLLAPAGSVLIWHDYGVPNQYNPGGPSFGVKKFIDQRLKAVMKQQGTSHVVVFVEPRRSSSIAFQALQGK